jgi:hypothetical protein
MKNPVIGKFIALAGLAALGSAEVAQAQQPVCVQPADLNDAIIYAVPLAYDAAMRSCASSYATDSFMRTGAPTFVEEFRALQDDTWPGAMRFMQTFMTADAEDSGDAAITAMIASLPEENLRPFVDGIVVEMLGSEIKGDSCDPIAEGMELLSPLPAENVGGLVALIADLAKVDNPPICGTVTLESSAQ